MKPTTKPRVKICCIASVAEAWLAIEAGASAIGLVSEMPSGPGPIPETLIAEIASTIPPGVSSFLLTCRQDPASIIEQQRRLRVNTIQICDRLPNGSHQELHEALPGVSLVQVVHVTGPESVDEAIAVAPHVDAVLLDSGNQSLAIKELGGTGRTHDWTLSREIREAIDVPMFLAGGLKPENVAAAIREVQPFGIDVCSGLRTKGRLDPEKLSNFFTQINADKCLSAFICVNLRLKGQLHSQLHLTRIAHTLSQEPVKVKKTGRRQRIDVVGVVEGIEHLDHRDNREAFIKVKWPLNAPVEREVLIILAHRVPIRCRAISRSNRLSTSCLHAEVSFKPPAQFNKRKEVKLVTDVTVR